MPGPNAFHEAALPLDYEESVLKKGDRLPSYIKEHRKRLRARFVEGGADAMPDYELLELALFFAIPQKDVKPTARDLIKAFGDFPHVLAASRLRLEEVKGIGEATSLYLKVVEAVAHRMARGQVLNRPVVTGWDDLVRYCQTAMAHRSTEQFRVLYLDRKNVLIADEAQSSGTVDHVPVYPREVVKRALELEASALILVHNHPSGDPTPSAEDIRQAAEALGLVLHDHLVIGKSREISFRSEGYL